MNKLFCERNCTYRNSTMQTHICFLIYTRVVRQVLGTDAHHPMTSIPQEMGIFENWQNYFVDDSIRVFGRSSQSRISRPLKAHKVVIKGFCVV